MRLPNNGVSVVELSANSKTGPVSATYAAQQTCPQDCPLKGSGCYAETGMVGFQTNRLNRNASGSGESLEDLAIAEALGIAGLTGERPLRLHVVGDATTDSTAKLLSDASEYHTNKHGKKVWTYTHAWRSVARRSWQGVSVFASCESTQDAHLAMAKGYAAAVVVSEHVSDRAHMVDGLKLIPCPQQTGRAATCLDCGLCMRANQLRDSGSVISFEVHGSRARKAAGKLVQIEIKFGEVSHV